MASRGGARARGAAEGGAACPRRAWLALGSGSLGLLRWSRRASAQGGEAASPAPALCVAGAVPGGGCPGRPRARRGSLPPSLASAGQAAGGSPSEAASGPAAGARQGFGRQTAPELRQLLRDFGLPAAGFKADLLARLEDHFLQACARGDAPLVARLLAAGAAVHGAGSPGDVPPIFAAAQGGHEEVVRVLVEAGAEPDAGVEGGPSPLGAAAEGGFDQAVGFGIGSPIPIPIPRDPT
ncbi:unnamed protein product, partial [Prorocentrum cordatum]